MATGTALELSDHAPLAVSRPVAPVIQSLPFLASDALAIFLTSATVVLTRYYFGGEFELSFYFRMSVVTLFFLAAYTVLGLYPAVMLHPTVELQRIFRGTTLTILLLGTLTFFQRDAEAYSRAILLASWFLITAAVWSARVITRRALSRTSWWGERAVILGAGRAGRTVAEVLHSRPGTGLRVVAILDDDPHKLAQASPLAPITAPLVAATQLANQFGVRYAIVAMPDAKGSEVTAIIEQYASRFHHVLIIPDLFRRLQPRRRCPRPRRRPRRPASAIAFSIAPPRWSNAPATSPPPSSAASSSPPSSPSSTSPSALLPQAPASTATAASAATASPFIAWKFRTMYRDANRLLDNHLDANPALRAEWQRDRKLKDDPRVTWIGRLLRRTSMDELPQLWNIVRGEMSLVGPRPIVTEEIDKYGRKYSLYQKVRPGLTGMWQVSGRNNTTYDERVQFDEYYVRNWSVWLDLYILARTIGVVLSGEGAY